MHGRPAMTDLPLRAPVFASALAHPRRIALACLVVLAGAGWLALGLLVGSEQGSLIAALCRPVAGTWPGLPSAALVLAMWGAMTLAMMLPTAGPMILTYAEITETAAAKREPVASPLALIAGYVAVWLGFAVAATGLQIALTAWLRFDPAVPFASALVSGALFVGAGLYQFSSLKHACLARCRRPFAFFFANWTARTAGVLRLGLRQGLYCLGCCWAMMSLMLAVGVMNVFWMAALGAVMTIEKMTGPRASRALGFAFIATGVVIASALAYSP